MFSILFLRLVCSSFGSCFTCLKHWLMVKTSEKTDHFNSRIPGSDSDFVLCWGVPHISFFAYVSVRHHKLLRLVSPLVTMNLLLRGSQVSYSGISSVYHLTTARLSLFGLRFVRSSNHLPILIRRSRRQPRQQQSLTPSQKQFQKVTSGVLSTGVRGAPRLTQCLDPVVSYFLITGLLRFSIVVSLQNDPTRFSVFETSKQATHTLPLQLKPPSPEKRHAPSTHRSSEESLFLGRGFSPTFDVVLVRRRLSSLKQELGIFQLLLGLTIPFRHSAPKLKLIVSQPISMWGWIDLLD